MQKRNFFFFFFTEGYYWFKPNLCWANVCFVADLSGNTDKGTDYVSCMIAAVIFNVCLTFFFQLFQYYLLPLQSLSFMWVWWAVGSVCGKQWKVGKSLNAAYFCKHSQQMKQMLFIGIVKTQAKLFESSESPSSISLCIFFPSHKETRFTFSLVTGPVGWLQCWNFARKMARLFLRG